jgi:hypothetical protein
LLLRRIQSQPIDKTTGVRSDWIVAANGVKTATAYPCAHPRIHHASLTGLHRRTGRLLMV